MEVFEFFFSAAAGITMGVGLVVIPCFFVYKKLHTSSRRGRQ